MIDDAPSVAIAQGITGAITEAIAGAIDEAIDALIALGEQDGSWRDFHLPVGESTQWVTAVAGLALAECARRRPSPRAAAAAHGAAAWLDRHQHYQAGWGFNAVTGPDADSTAHALLLRATLNLAVRDRDLAFLAGHRGADGGFGTYGRAADAWGQSHPCVTPVAELALHACGGGPEDGGVTALRYGLATRRRDGTWPCYWWDSRFYATWHYLILQHRTGWLLPPPAEPIGFQADSLFDLIWLTGIAEMLGAAAWRDMLAVLLGARNRDGGWPGQRVLRVTEPDCPEPWREAKGQCYADQRGILTTAFALRMLTRLGMSAT
jgi:hypothetical protein